jgi:hypothetical protein
MMPKPIRAGAIGRNHAFALSLNSRFNGLLAMLVTRAVHIIVFGYPDKMAKLGDCLPGFFLEPSVLILPFVFHSVGNILCEQSQMLDVRLVRKIRNDAHRGVKVIIPIPV